MFWRSSRWTCRISEPIHGAGNRVFNMWLWMPPGVDRAGDILLADSTIFPTLFGGGESLENFWKNIATK